MLSRQTAESSRSSSAEAVLSPQRTEDLLTDKKQVFIGGVEASGSRMKFEEDSEVAVTDLGGDEEMISQDHENNCQRMRKGKEKPHVKKEGLEILSRKPGTEVSSAKTTRTLEEKTLKKARREAKRSQAQSGIELEQADMDELEITRAVPNDLSCKPRVKQEIIEEQDNQASDRKDKKRKRDRDGGERKNVIETIKVKKERIG